jgi:hypothetical protein
MIHKVFLRHLPFTFLVSSPQGGLHNFCGTWLCCNSLEWNNHSASLRLALHPKNRTLHPVQLPDLGSSDNIISSLFRADRNVERKTAYFQGPAGGGLGQASI